MLGAARADGVPGMPAMFLSKLQSMSGLLIQDI